MKAASIVLLTAAWLAGDHHHTTATPCCGGTTVISSSCSGCASACDSCCHESFLDRLRNRFSGLFHRNDCCDPCTTYSVPCATPSCGQTISCDPCCESNRWQFGSRLRGLFHRSNSCCDPCTTYSTPCCGGTVIHNGAKVGEPIPIPAPKDGGAKKMPNAPEKKDNKGGAGKVSAGGEPPIGAGDLQIQNPIAGPVPASDPNITIVPPAAPSFPGTLGNRSRSPF